MSNTVWAANPETGKDAESYYMKFEDYPFHHAMWDAWKAQKKRFIYTIEGEEKEIYDEYLYSETEFRRFPKEVQKANKALSRYVAGFTFFEHSGLQTVSEDAISENDLAILERFGRVFEQAYTRFLDLQKAEEQARESEIQLALERVRARSLAMHQSDELADLSLELVKQVQALGIDTWFCAFNIYDGHPEGSIEWGSNGQGTFPSYRTPREGVFLDYYEAGQRGETLLINEIGEDECPAHYDYLCSLPGVGDQLLKMKDEGIPFPASQIDHVAFFKYGYIIFITFEPVPEAHDIFERFAKVFQQTYTRFLDLKKAEEQAREAQIEASLERVRAKAMSMQNSDELDEVLSVLCEQFDVLGIFPMSTHMTVFNFDNNTFTFRETGKYGDRSFGEQTVDLDAMDTWKETVEKWKADKATAVNKLHFPKETLPEVWEVFHKSFASMPEESRITPDDYPDGIYHTAGKHPFGYIGMNQVRPATGEEEQIVIKFANEFGRAYQRFLDLKKAEEQAREAKIETALEKIRSRTMAMQKGEELQEVAVLLYKELIALGVTNFVTCGYVEVNEEIQRQHTWVTAPGGDTMGLFHLPLTGDDTFDVRYAAWKKQQTVFHQSVAGQVRSDHLEYAITTFNSKEAEEMVRIQFPDPTVFYCFNFSHGYLHIVGGSLLEKEEENLLARFTKVFEQTYTRFLDLQKAEEQAREAKIEMSLEKIRSRTMGMQGSEELPEVANMLFLEVQELGIPAWSCGYCILEEDRRSSICIMSSEGTFQKPFLLPHHGEVSFEEWDDFVQGDQSFFTQELGGKAIESHYDFMKSLPQLGPVLKDIEEAGLSLPEYQINHLCKFAHGFLLFITYEPVADSHDIFKRFTKVFDQTYTRFLDLKKVEKQARESSIEAALDRVRAEIASMRSTKDLERITPLVWRELTTLGIPFIRCGVFIIHEEEKEVEVYLSKPDGTSLAVMHLPFGSSELAVQTVNAWHQKSVYTQHWTQEEFLDWGRSMMEQGQVQNMETYQGAEEAPESLHLHFVPFNQGMLYIGSTGPLNDEEISLSGSLAKAFSIAYARYEDFVKLEKAKAGIEDALTELKATQSQLIQQEKLASLGQLTAGIAHEIKNPLNFVNNFSEVSLELVEEAREEVKSTLPSPSGRGAGGEGEQGSETDLILEILDDIEANLKTIHKHGSRADSIVKSMLQHSRGGDGKMEPTPLNPLIKEYVNLAFHGMRAGKEPIEVDIDLNLDESIGEVPLIAEDFSRVILNVCNNGFDAMRDKLTGDGGPETGETYIPKLKVRTRKTDSTITLEIQDNGPGIPNDIKDKILQPFFTTKKGTQGTGLGLSITNDIIKAHGGGIEIKSLPGEGSTFTIQLPKQGL